MKYYSFIQGIPELYKNWHQADVYPKSVQLQNLASSIKHDPCQINIIQLVNFALSFLEQDEVYCKISTKLNCDELVYELQGHADKVIYLIESPHSQSESLEESQQRLFEDLVEQKSYEDLYFFSQEFEDFFYSLLAEQVELKIGVYFYDTFPDYRSTLMALLLAKSCLSAQALLVVHNTRSAFVQQAIYDFISSHLQCQLLLELPPTLGNYPKFGQGLALLKWDMTPEQSIPTSEGSIVRNPVAIHQINRFTRSLEQQRKEAVLKLKKTAVEAHRAGLPEEAIKAYYTALKWNNSDPELWQALAIAHFNQQAWQPALEAIKCAVEINPTSYHYHYNLGLIAEQLGDYTQAISAYQFAIHYNSQYTKAFNNLARLHQSLGNVDLALNLYKHAIEVEPEHYGSYINLGNLLMAQAAYQEAGQYYKQALKLQPQNPDILYNLALALKAQGQVSNSYLNFAFSAYYKQSYPEAIKYFNQYLDNAKANAYTYQILAQCYRHLDRIEDAIKICQQGMQNHPHDRTMYYTTGLMLHLSCRDPELQNLLLEAKRIFIDDLSFELECLRFLPALYNSEQEILSYRHHFSQSLDTIETLLNALLTSQKSLIQACQSLKYTVIFYLFYQGKNDLILQQRYGSIVHKIMAAVYPQWIKPIVRPVLGVDQGVNQGINQGVNQKIKVGYISQCMANHTIGRMTLGWLKGHDRNQFELYAYAINEQVDALTQQFQIYSNHFYHLPQNIEKICNHVLADRLHILVFLDMLMFPLPMQLASLRLAPVQCKFWGPPVTSGLATIDYFLSSDLMEPEDGDQYYSETLVRLPNIAISYPKPDISTLTKTASDFGIADDKFCYLSCQAPEKYLPQYDYIFPKIAQRVPKAHFVFVGRRNRQITHKFIDRLSRAFASFNLSFEQWCVVTPYLNADDFLNLTLISDVFLDTFEWSGGKTTLDALACKLPVVTCPGQFLRGRHAYGILCMLGMGDTIARNPTDYIDIAVNLGLNADWYQEIVAKICQHHDRLYNDSECVQGLETFYRHVTSTP